MTPIRQRTLGATGQPVSVVALGTVALGKSYGIERPGDHGKPAAADVARLLERAADRGVTLFDTAPDYGDAEVLLGRALAHRRECLFATKVAAPREANGDPLSGSDLIEAIDRSIAGSLRALGRDAIDVLQVFKVNRCELERGDIGAALLRAREQGKVRFIGASVYTEDEALAAVAARFDLCQVPYNLLDRQMERAVFPAAIRSRIGLVTRSAFLKGVLTDKAPWLPPELADLRVAAEAARDRLAGSWDRLPEVALRYCLSSPAVSTVLVGVRTIAELDRALDAAAKGPLDDEQLARIADLPVPGERLLNPSTWSLV